MSTSKQRREAERRRLQRQRERRVERQAKQRRITLALSILGAIAVIALVVGFVAATTGEDAKKKTAAASPTTPATSTSAGTPAASGTTPRVPGVCDFVTAGTAVRPAKPPATKAPTRGTVRVSVATTQGAMTLMLDRAAAPCTVAGFVSLVAQKFYDSTPCHRLTTSGIFVLQCGDPTGSGQGGPGYTVPDEASGAERYPAGTIAMARAQGAHTGGSQFFIVYRDSPNLAQGLGALQHTVFGRVTSGLPVVTRVAAAGASTGTDGKPKLPVTIVRASLLR